MGATLFHFVRHASHDYLGRVMVGRAAVPINAAGELEARAVADAMAGLCLSAVISSPQRRALQTADFISARAGVPVTVDQGLDELNMGAWTGANLDILHDDPAWHAFNHFRSAATIPGGEAIITVQERAVRSVLRIRAAYPTGSLALVSHADVIKAVLVHFLGMPLDLMQRIDIAPCSRSVLALNDRNAVIRAINLPFKNEPPVS